MMNASASSQLIASKHPNGMGTLNVAMAVVIKNGTRPRLTKAQTTP